MRCYQLLLLLPIAATLALPGNAVPRVNQPELSGTSARAGGQLVGFLEKFKNTLRHGNASLGIPVLDPLKQKHLDLDLTAAGMLSLQGALDDLRVLGLANYMVSRGDFTLAGFKVNVTLVWDEIMLMTKYFATGSLLGGVPLHGNGDIGLAVSGTNVSVDMKLSVIDKKISVTQLALHAHVQEFDCKITGLFDDEDLSDIVSRVLTDVVSGLLDDYQDQVAQYASPIVAKLLNNILKDLTLKDLLDMISG